MVVFANVGNVNSCCLNAQERDGDYLVFLCKTVCCLTNSLTKVRQGHGCILLCAESAIVLQGEQQSQPQCRHSHLDVWTPRPWPAMSLHCEDDFLPRYFERF